MWFFTNRMFVESPQSWINNYEKTWRIGVYLRKLYWYRNFNLQLIKLKLRLKLHLQLNGYQMKSLHYCRLKEPVYDFCVCLWDTKSKNYSWTTNNEKRGIIILLQIFPRILKSMFLTTSQRTLVATESAWFFWTTNVRTGSRKRPRGWTDDVSPLEEIQKRRDLLSDESQTGLSCPSPKIKSRPVATLEEWAHTEYLNL